MMAPHIDIEETVRAVFGAAPEQCERLEGGANNVCLRIVVDGRTVLGKVYFRHPRDRRDRLGAEFGMLAFLWRHGIRCIPEPLAQHRESNTGFYQFIEGRCPTPEEISLNEVRQMSELLSTMSTLKNRTGADHLPAGSDASSAIRDYLECVRGRLDRILSHARSSASSEQFRTYAEDELDPAHTDLMEYIVSSAETRGLDLDAKLSRDQLTLNPADHGFHNTLRGRDGKLVFLDFEYAGWDDPVQMLANACLQPRVPLPAGLRVAFVRETLMRLACDQHGLVERLQTVYPLLAFKWALIMLNEFLPVSGERRRFAGTDTAARRTEQLHKSRQRLRMVTGYLADDTLFAPLRPAS